MVHICRTRLSCAQRRRSSSVLTLTTSSTIKFSDVVLRAYIFFAFVVDVPPPLHLNLRCFKGSRTSNGRLQRPLRLEQFKLSAIVSKSRLFKDTSAGGGFPGSKSSVWQFSQKVCGSRITPTARSDDTRTAGYMHSCKSCHMPYVGQSALCASPCRIPSARGPATLPASAPS